VQVNTSLVNWWISQRRCDVPLVWPRIGVWL